MTRQLIVVDTETTGLHAGAVILEVAAVNIETGEELHFVPFVSRDQLADAKPDALRINRYYERGVYADMRTTVDTRTQYALLRTMLTGNTFAGSNPTFDTRLIAAAQWVDPKEYVAFGMNPIVRKFGDPWHHRLLDSSAYAAGVLGIHPSELPGAAALCELLGVDNEEEHGALGDARATADCFRALMLIRDAK